MTTSLAQRAAAPHAVPLPTASLGLVWRPISEGDLGPWLELEQAIEEADELNERFTADDLRDELLSGSWKDPSRDTLLGVDDAGTPRAFALVESRPGDTRNVRVYGWGGVHPDWRRRGVGRPLLAWQVARARQLLAASTRDVPGRILVHAREGSADREALLRAGGFEVVRWYSDMRRPLTVPGAPPVPTVDAPAGLRLVPFARGLDEQVRLAHNDAFSGHWGSEPRGAEDWEAWTTGHRDFRGDWSFVVLDGREVMGYALSAAYPQDWAAQGFTQGWTNLVGVREPYRGRGIAVALLVASMRAFAADGMDHAGLDVDTQNTSGALSLYTGLGYEAVERTAAWAIEV